MEIKIKFRMLGLLTIGLSLWGYLHLEEEMQNDMLLINIEALAQTENSVEIVCMYPGSLHCPVDGSKVARIRQ